MLYKNQLNHSLWPASLIFVLSDHSLSMWAIWAWRCWFSSGCFFLNQPLWVFGDVLLHCGQWDWCFRSSYFMVVPVLFLSILTNFLSSEGDGSSSICVLTYQVLTYQNNLYLYLCTVVLCFPVEQRMDGIGLGSFFLLVYACILPLKPYFTVFIFSVLKSDQNKIYCKFS